MLFNGSNENTIREKNLPFLGHTVLSEREGEIECHPLWTKKKQIKKTTGGQNAPKPKNMHSD